MTMTIDVSPEAKARLEAEAARRGMAADEYTRESFEVWLNLTVSESDAEETLFKDMQALSLSALKSTGCTMRTQFTTTSEVNKQ